VAAFADAQTDTHVDNLPPSTVTIALTFVGTIEGVADGEIPKAGYSQSLRTELASMFSVDVEQVRIQTIEGNPYTPQRGFTYSVTIAILPTVLGESLSADDVSEAFETAQSASRTPLTIAEHPLSEIGTIDVVAPPEQSDDAAPPPATTPAVAQLLGRYSLAVKAAPPHFVRGCMLSSFGASCIRLAAPLEVQLCCWFSANCAERRRLSTSWERTRDQSTTTQRRMLSRLVTLICSASKSTWGLD
jgi:hypothetical protein